MMLSKLWRDRVGPLYKYFQESIILVVEILFGTYFPFVSKIPAIRLPANFVFNPETLAS